MHFTNPNLALHLFQLSSSSKEQAVVVIVVVAAAVAVYYLLQQNLKVFKFFQHFDQFLLFLFFREKHNHFQYPPFQLRIYEIGQLLFLLVFLFPSQTMTFLQTFFQTLYFFPFFLPQTIHPNKSLQSFTILFSFLISFFSLHLSLVQITNQLYLLWVGVFEELHFEVDLIGQDIIVRFFLLVTKILLIDFIELILHFFVPIVNYLPINQLFDFHRSSINCDLQIKALLHHFQDSLNQ